MPTIRTEVHRCGFTDFAKENLPHGLMVHTHCEGYSSDINYIEQRGTGTTFMGMCSRNKVAQLYWNGKHNAIDVLDPKYFSDLEDLASKYEEYSHEKVELILHEYVPCKQYGE